MERIRQHFLILILKYMTAKNDAVAALAEQAQSDQTGTTEDTRPWYRKFFDWLLGKVGIITASAEEAKKKEIAAAEAANNGAEIGRASCRERV